MSPSVAFITTSQLAVESPLNFKAMEVPAGSGTGFVWDEAGHVVTNYHVIAGRGGGAPPRVKVRLQGYAEAFDAVVKGVEPDKDIAVLKIESGSLPAPSPSAPRRTSPSGRRCSRSATRLGSTT